VGRAAVRAAAATAQAGWLSAERREASVLGIRDSNPNFDIQSVACCRLHQSPTRLASIGSDSPKPTPAIPSGRHANMCSYCVDVGRRQRALGGRSKRQRDKPDTSRESPHAYRISRRLERAAALLRCADRSAAEICSAVRLSSVGSFTTSISALSSPPAAATTSLNSQPSETQAGRLRPTSKWRANRVQAMQHA
jgi:hypothetical protein